MLKTPKLSRKTPTIIRTPVEGLIRVVRGQKIMLDSDLAGLYGVPTFRLNEAVKRNICRFPDDFMFRLSSEEGKSLTSQIAMSKGRGGRRTLPNAFTESGVAMLSSVLNSERAVQMNIAFVRMREIMAHNRELAARMEKLERNHDHTSSVIEVIVEDIDRLAQEIDLIKNPPVMPKRKTGYIFHDD